jgi:hypothetical protein
MSELIKKGNGEPFGTLESAKAARTRMGDEGLNTNVIEVEGGFALAKKPEKKRPKRVPIGRRGRLTVDKKNTDPAYKYRWVNQTDDRLTMYEEAGWEYVKEKVKVGDGKRPEEAKQIGSAVKKPVGRDVVAYLMRIKKEWYQEDQDAKSEKIKETMKELKRQPEKPGQYGKIKIRE